VAVRVECKGRNGLSGWKELSREIGGQEKDPTDRGRTFPLRRMVSSQEWCGGGGNMTTHDQTLKKNRGEEKDNVKKKTIKKRNAHKPKEILKSSSIQLGTCSSHQEDKKMDNQVEKEIKNATI